MAKPFKVSIVTPEKKVFEAEAVSIVLPGSEGYLGIWANHAPLVTGIEPGVIRIKEADSGAEAKMRYMSVSNGFLEVAGNEVSILCDSCEFAREIDLNRAKAALKRARERLHEGADEVDKERARLAVERAQARLHAAYLREGHRD